MCTVTVKGRNVFIDGMSFGSTYANHETAIHQGKKVHEKHYPQAKFEIISETITITEPKTKTKKKKIAKT